jgi:hypothetical protein
MGAAVTPAAQNLDQIVRGWVMSSHRRQFRFNTDYQRISWEFLNSPQADELGLTADDEEIWQQVETSPHPDCDCGFCATADWQ